MAIPVQIIPPPIATKLLLVPLLSQQAPGHAPLILAMSVITTVVNLGVVIISASYKL